MSSIFVVMGKTFVGGQLAFKLGAKEERSNCNHRVLSVYAQKQVCAHAYKALEMPMGHAHLNFMCSLVYGSMECPISSLSLSATFLYPHEAIDRPLLSLLPQEMWLSPSQL